MVVKNIQYFKPFKESYQPEESFFKDTRGLRKRRGETQDLGGKKRSVTKMNSRSLGWSETKEPPLSLIIHAPSKTEDATRKQPPPQVLLNSRSGFQSEKEDH